MKFNQTCLTALIIEFSCFIMSQSSMFYKPFDSYNHPERNSVYGTGNRLMDVAYRSYCAIQCKVDYYSDQFCCNGETLNEVKCMTKDECYTLKSRFQNYIIVTTIVSYIIIVLVSMVVGFIIAYCLTKDEKFKHKNAICVAVLVVCGAFIIPIIIVYLIAKYKEIEIPELFSANLTLISGFDYLDGVDIKENDKRSANFNNKPKNTPALNSENKRSCNEPLDKIDANQIEIEMNSNDVKY